MLCSPVVEFVTYPSREPTDGRLQSASQEAPRRVDPCRARRRLRRHRHKPPLRGQGNIQSRPRHPAQHVERARRSVDDLLVADDRPVRLQRQGTSLLGALFGPLAVVWFFAIAALGIRGIASAPEVLWALNPLQRADDMYVITVPTEDYSANPTLPDLIKRRGRAAHNVDAEVLDV
jgi:hypothetical protein